MKQFSRSFPATRMRRSRFTQGLRNLIAENNITVHDLIYPLFVLPGKNQQSAIQSMPGLNRLSSDLLLAEIEELLSLGLNTIALFPVIPAEQKSTDAKAAYDENGLIQNVIAQVKRRFPEIIIIADVALDPYTSHGQDGIIDDTGHVLNDVTNFVLTKQALSLAQAGADIIAPSDMMDGRIGMIRQHLEKEGLHNTAILAYAAKYASAFYGPFREAVGSNIALGKANKKQYQMDPANFNEALHEVALDINEGADMVMVKPGLPYLDIIHAVKETFKVPTFAYQVSGEYSMIKAAAQNGWLNEQACVLETLLCLKRAGSDAIFSYYAKEVASWIKKGEIG